METLQFSDLEVEQTTAILRSEFDEDEDWSVVVVERQPDHLDVIDARITNVQDHRTLTIRITREEFPGGYFPNESQLTDPVFDISIRLMEFNGIRGFDEFEDGGTVSIADVYSDGWTTLSDLPEVPPGARRNLISPLVHPELFTSIEDDYGSES